MLNAPAQAVMTKASKRNGMIYPAKQTGYFIRIAGKGPNVQIEVLKMNDTTKELDSCKTFKLGDTAEHDSYNFAYLGDIVSITEKTVTITDRVGEPTSRLHRLDMYTFCWRNWDLDLVATAKRNMETSYNI